MDQLRIERVLVLPDVLSPVTMYYVMDTETTPTQDVANHAVVSNVKCYVTSHRDAVGNISLYRVT
jgi:hypothetical protein